MTNMYGMVWDGMAWYGMAWHGMIWYGMVWYDMVWYDMVWYGMYLESVCLLFCACFTLQKTRSAFFTSQNTPAKPSTKNLMEPRPWFWMRSSDGEKPWRATLGQTKISGRSAEKLENICDNERWRGQFLNQTTLVFLIFSPPISFFWVWASPLSRVFM